MNIKPKRNDPETYSVEPLKMEVESIAIHVQKMEVQRAKPSRKTQRNHSAAEVEKLSNRRQVQVLREYLDDVYGNINPYWKTKRKN